MTIRMSEHYPLPRSEDSIIPYISDTGRQPLSWYDWHPPGVLKLITHCRLIMEKVVATAYSWRQSSFTVWLPTHLEFLDGSTYPPCVVWFQQHGLELFLRSKCNCQTRGAPDIIVAVAKPIDVLMSRKRSEQCPPNVLYDISCHGVTERVQW